MALAMVEARRCCRFHFGVESLDERGVHRAAVPTQAAALDELVQRIGPGGIDHRQPRDAVDQAQLVQLVEGLAEGAGVAQVAAGDDDPVGHFPAQAFQHPVHDRLLPFQAEGIDAVDQVDAQLLADFLHAGHGVVEVAADLHRQAP